MIAKVFSGMDSRTSSKRKRRGKRRRKPPDDNEDLRGWLTKKPRTEVSPSARLVPSNSHKSRHPQHVSDPFSALLPAVQFDSPGPSRYGHHASSTEYASLRTDENRICGPRAEPSASFAMTSTLDLRSDYGVNEPSFVHPSAASSRRRAKRTRHKSLNSSSDWSSSPKRATPHRGGGHSVSPAQVRGSTDSFRDVLGLRGLSQLPPENVVVHIHEQEWTHFCRFLRSTYSCCDNAQLPLFVSVVYKVGIASLTLPHIRQWANDILAEMCSADCVPFWGGLAVLIRKLPFVRKQDSDLACNVLGLALALLHSEDKELYVPYLPLDDLYSSASQTTCQNEENKELVKLVGDIVEERNKIRLATKRSDEDDRDSGINHVAVLPTPAELIDCNISTSIERNVVKGQYRSSQHYLQLHCNLLREDFVHPLRCALHKVQKEEEEEGRDVKIYKKVTLEGTDVTNAGLVYLMHFFLPKRNRVNWEHSKRLLYGALVCLSCDQFVSVTFATVANRKLEDLRKGLISLRFIDHLPKNGLPINPKIPYKMIESPGYFEAFAPVIRCLTSRARKCDALPFARYLVSCDADMLPPLCLRTKANPLMNIRGIACSCKSDTEVVEEPLRNQCNLDAIPILDKEMWDAALQSCNSMKLDESQIIALHTALVNELALIQGPPGTGKTYIGIKLVEILLRNRKLWQGPRKSPITVMCYTNHALDQFLQGILDVPDLNAHIYRVGGRSKSEKISSLNIMNAMPRIKRKGWSPKMLPELETKIQALLELCRGTFNHMNKALYYLFLHPDWVLDHSEYAPVIEAMHIGSRKMMQEEMAKQMFFQLGISVQEPETAEHQMTADEEDVSIFRLYQQKEDERRILDDTFKSYERDWMYKLVSVKELQRFVNSLQYIQPIVSTEQKTLTQAEVRGVLKQCFISLLDFYYEQHDRLLEKKAVHSKQDDDSMARILGEADIVGFTTTGAAKSNEVISKLKSKILIVEEAAEVLEAHIVAALTRHNEHLILIGDHKQLRPKTNDNYLGTHYGLEVSLFERLVNNGFQCATLAYQHRMRPEISSLVHPHIYPDLKDHDSVLHFSDVKGMKHNLYFISHVQQEMDNEDLKSPSNEHEACFLSSLCKYLFQQGYTAEQITALTPYTGQVICLKNAFRKYGIRGVRIVPIDHFQGEENDIILLSLVRSLKPGFVKVDNRVCVSLSRAKKGFYCIGNFQLFSKHSKLWENIVASVQDKKLIGNALPLQCQLHNEETVVSSSDDFGRVPDGGCRRRCGTRLTCGHICPRKCHPSDLDHSMNPCEKPCTKQCAAGLHQCLAKCYQRCPPCDIYVSKMLPWCGHEQMMPCYVDPYNCKCLEPCPDTLPCHHRCQGKCGQECTVECHELVKRMWLCGHEAQEECYVTEEQYMTIGHCKVPCKVELSCGHECSGKCGECRQGRLHVPCKQKCKRGLLCGHPSTSETCSNICPPCKKKCPTQCIHGDCGHSCDQLCIKCQEPCEWKCDHHRCTRPCGELCNRPACNSPCPKQLKCKHSCLGLCGESCPPICRECDPEHEAFQVFFGNEAEPDAHFIQLQDCECIFEVRDIDRYMDVSPDEGEDVAVQWKRCPKCSVIISATQRYTNYIKRIKTDMNQIKMRQNRILDSKERQQFIKEVLELSEKHRTTRIPKDFKNVLTCSSDHFLLKELTVLRAMANATSVHVKMKQVCLQLSALAKSQGTNALIASCKSLQGQADSFLAFLSGYKCRSLLLLPDQIGSDINAEQNRLALISQLYLLLAEITYQHFIDLSPEEHHFIEHIKSAYNPRNGRIQTTMDQDKYDELTALLNMIVDSHPELKEITEEERREIVKAMGGQKGSWYKCHNGHYYQIGECGGAMTTGRCIECRATVGGSQHRLRDDNAHAPEMDGSRHPAWGEQANMQNYNLEHAEL